ncbi:cytochrome c biogenesis CcdA family protein [Polynucleobacter sp. es-MAR-4]|uniref:cytochrome c biogenesis CcdA family protein n=1 Tax=Polynucleobacter sp. es-MAR-4 TaxID=1855655 RepID=UPI001C0B769B|nr:cytochrome c biogenesis CcdA family protein [Polynucleobacter sp. es-MAR-4]MBU3636071.1 cytochrome c biogenesis protein CcdA [Polynucleobacter sp. es-MAR-4]
MEFGLASYLLAFGAGILSTLSPCVIPILPIILTTAFNQHRFGALALAFGLALSFAIIGTTLASIGASVGITQGGFRFVAAIIMGVLGVVLLSKRLQDYFTQSISSVGGFGNSLLSKITINGLTGQFVIGLLLGLIWSPCVGPTLGAAIALASQGAHISSILLMMGVFGFGAGLPLAILGFVSRSVLNKARGRLANAGSIGKKILGMFLLIISILILAGWDKSMEAFLVEISPAWLTELTTSL